jgi:transcriptional regulator with XRE-family HTH domain
MKPFDFRPKICKAVLLSGFSLPEIARKAGLSHACVSNYLKGKTDIYAKNLIKLLEALEITVRLDG